MSGMLMDERFVAAFPSLARALGSLESAVILQYLNWGDETGEGARFTYAEISNGTGISERTVRRRITDLTSLGVLLAERAGVRDAAYIYRVNKGHDVLVCPGGQSGQVEVANLATSSVLTRSKNPPTPLVGQVKVPGSRSSVVEETSRTIDAFEEWWEAYPNKTNQRATSARFFDLLARGVVHETTLIEAVKLLNRWEYDSRDPSMVPTPSNWLRDERWNDADQYRDRERAFDSEEALNRGD